ncbi:alcohol dehydrogenase catalytic domain-containing protein [Streptomyces sp. NBC_01476]|uniref:alcohol dehydrogenase catalytic domain-containing protein n=1 Tax=Streptomyces sp. NBC_01476 TaxID=2903881 RepID=UPI002E362BFA|nr:alcohol dehydrogenase catalytic domain-containing protein [Streptomyces sp. NBC_01476]
MSGTMRAAVTAVFGQPPEPREVPVPTAAPDELLIKVRSVGLCGSDLKVNSGAIPGLRTPLIQGHEVSGEVVSGPAGWAGGERVALYTFQPCNQCAWCLRGQTNLCPTARRIGFERDGGLAEYVTARPVDVVRFGPDLGFDAAAVTMDAVLTPWRAVRVRAGLKPGERLAVVGAGGLGLHAVQIAVALGAHVAVVDLSQARRASALELGAELAVGPDSAEEILDWSAGGVDAALEASGAPAGFTTAVRVVRPGGAVVCCGYKPGSDVAADSMKLALAELTVLGSRGGARADAAEAVAAVERGEVRPLIAKAGGMDDVPRFFEELAAGESVGRLVVHPSGS